MAVAGRGSWRFVAALVPLAVVAALAHVVALWFREQPGACAACHSMRSAHDEWARSTHAGVPCASCHMPAGSLLGREAATLARLGRCVGLALGAAPRVTTVDAAACLSCHSAFFRVKALKAAKHVLHPHAQCASCHRGLVHRRYDRDALTLAIRDSGHSLSVDADFPKRLVNAFSDKDHFQHGFVKTMAFCGRCHRMAAAPLTQAPAGGAAVPGGAVCENCHVRY